MIRRLYPFVLSVLPVLLLGAVVVHAPGCVKNRLFTTVDSIPEIPSQFHFFNAFDYDSALNLSIDNLVRERVGKYRFSAYYPSSSSFNVTEQSTNSKLIAIADAGNSGFFATSATFQFQPNTSYLVYPQYGPYDTLNTPVRTIVPSLQYIPEDPNRPTNGQARVRFIDMMAGTDNDQLTLSPDEGAGTSLNLNPLSNNGGITSAPTTYTGTQPGSKTVVVHWDGVALTYLPVQLGNANYTFIEVGDPKNYLNGLEPVPVLYLLKDGDPQSLTPLTLSNITYPGYSTTTAQVTIINGAYNIPGVYSVGAGQNQSYPNLGISFNNYTASLLRWPVYPDPTRGYVEDVGDTHDPAGAYPSLLVPSNGSTGRFANLSLPPGIYASSFTPLNAFAPVYTSFVSTLQIAKSYTVCLLPDDHSATTCGSLLLNNDLSPVPGVFRLRIINLMAGAPAVDVHLGGGSGPLLAAAVPFAQATVYVNLPASSVMQTLYVTPTGSSSALFPQDSLASGSKAMNIPYTSGNSATVYLMGLVPGAPYSGSSGAFGPYVLYLTDAFVNANNVFNYGNAVQLYW